MKTPSSAIANSVPQGLTVSLAPGGRLSPAQTEALSRFHLALCVPREWLDVGAKLLEVCGNPEFAKEAFYKRSIGGEDRFGLTIRFAEKALQILRNISTDLSPEHEDEHAVHYRFALTDIESNSLASETFRVSKTVESRDVDDDTVVISERTTKGGDKIYVTFATDDQLAARVRNVASRVKRGLVLGLLPAEVRAQCLAKCLEVSLDADKQDSAGAHKAVLMTFLGLGLDAAALKEYLGKPLQAASEKELQELRGIATSIREGEATWSAVLTNKRESEAKKTALGKLVEDKKKQAVANKAKARGDGPQNVAAPSKARGRRGGGSAGASSAGSDDGAGATSTETSDGEQSRAGQGTNAPPARPRASRHDDDDEAGPEAVVPPNGVSHPSPS